MGNKISYALKKCKSVFIIAIILWVIVSIVLIAPISIRWVESVEHNNGSFIDNLMNSNIGNIGNNLSKAFSKEYIGNYLKCELWVAILILGFSIIGMIKTMPKHDYADIEHGSSDWAKGEEYSILSRNKGILLAEKHYLPVDKRGNTNVLVVGRFWFW